MSPTDLDTTYTALCEALGEAGPQGSPLLLAMITLALAARMPDAASVLPLIEQARAQLRGEAGQQDRFARRDIG